MNQEALIDRLVTFDALADVPRDQIQWMVEKGEVNKLKAGEIAFKKGDSIFKSEKGFILTGRDVEKEEVFKKHWKKEREPFLLETSTPGIFTAGDVREGAMNRVASAVGEGAMAIKFVHEYLAEV